MIAAVGTPPFVPANPVLDAFTSAIADAAVATGPFVAAGILAGALILVVTLGIRNALSSFGEVAEDSTYKQISTKERAMETFNRAYDESRYDEGLSEDDSRAAAWGETSDVYDRAARYGFK